MNKLVKFLGGLFGFLFKAVDRVFAVVAIIVVVTAGIMYTPMDIWVYIAMSVLMMVAIFYLGAYTWVGWQYGRRLSRKLGGSWTIPTIVAVLIPLIPLVEIYLVARITGTGLNALYSMLLVVGVQIIAVATVWGILGIFQEVYRIIKRNWIDRKTEPIHHYPPVERFWRWIREVENLCLVLTWILILGSYGIAYFLTRNLLISLKWNLGMSWTDYIFPATVAVASGIFYLGHKNPEKAYHFIQWVERSCKKVLNWIKDDMDSYITYGLLLFAEIAAMYLITEVSQLDLRAWLDPRDVFAYKVSLVSYAVFILGFYSLIFAPFVCTSLKYVTRSGRSYWMIGSFAVTTSGIITFFPTTEGWYPDLPVLVVSLLSASLFFAFTTPTVARMKEKSWYLRSTTWLGGSAISLLAGFLIAWFM